jgi:hypothetical protein
MNEQTERVAHRRAVRSGVVGFIAGLSMFAPAMANANKISPGIKSAGTALLSLRENNRQTVDSEMNRKMGKLTADVAKLNVAPGKVRQERSPH